MSGRTAPSEVQSRSTRVVTVQTILRWDQSTRAVKGQQRAGWEKCNWLSTARNVDKVCYNPSVYWIMDQGRGSGIVLSLFFTFDRFAVLADAPRWSTHVNGTTCHFRGNFLILEYVP